MENGLPIAVLGAGLAGLAAASELTSRGVPVRIFEASSAVGGLARSVQSLGGLSIDIGAHFVTSRLAKQLGVEALCATTHRYEESVHIGGRWHRMPFGLLRLPGALKDLIVSQVGIRDGRASAVQHDNVRLAAERSYGTTLARRVVVPQLEAWSGIDADALAASTIDALPSSFVASAALHAWRYLTGIPLPLGYSKEEPVTLGMRLLYPKSGGVGALMRRYAEPLRELISLETPAEEIHFSGGRAVEVTTSEGTIPVSGVIFTLPITQLPSLCPGLSSAAGVSKFQFRALRILNLRIRGRSQLRDTVSWFPERGSPYFRITDVSRAAPWIIPPGESVLAVDIGQGSDFAESAKSAHEALAFVGAHLQEFVPQLDSRVIDASVTNVRFGYPLFLTDYEEERAEIGAKLARAGIWMAGRNAEFRHLLMEDVYWRSTRLARRLDLRC